jgi:hypothetical protein
LFLTTSLSVKAKAEAFIDINELIENAKKLDGEEVVIQGEAIGERMDRGNYSWININDGTNAIGIWLKERDADKVLYYGNYKNIGDTLKITGIFNRACMEHGGEADFHSVSIEIVEEGYQNKEQIASVKIISAAILMPFAFLLMVLLTRKIKRL